jgi:predicted TPR repeat methyltransferase
MTLNQSLGFPTQERAGWHGDVALVALRGVAVLIGGLTMLLPSYGQAQPAAIGPLVAPPRGTAASATPDCAAWVKNCDKRAATTVAGEADELARLVQSADELLFAGDEKAAWAQLNRVLRIDPKHRVALMLMTQIADDPRKLLGDLTESYTPRPGETLRQIAAARLGDARWFFVLARYNGIEVPRVLESGRPLRVPPVGSRVPLVATRGAAAAPGVGLAGQPSPAGSGAGASEVSPSATFRLPTSADSLRRTQASEVAPATATEVAGNAEGAFRLGAEAEKTGRVELAYVHYMRAFTLGHAAAGERAAAMRQELIARHKRTARAAQERGDADRAYRAWRNVLELDPDDSAAAAEVRRLQQQARKDAGRKQ